MRAGSGKASCTEFNASTSAKNAPVMPEDEEAARAVYTHWLERAYQDFVNSDALTEKVFAVFQHTPNEAGGTTSFVSIDKVFQT